MKIKTDWLSTDYFEYTDYNRIKSNIEFLTICGFSLYEKWYPIPIKTLDYPAFYFSETFNSIEDNIEALAKYTFRPLNFEPTKTFKGNISAWNNEDVNRIERTVLLYLNIFNSQKEGKKTLSFELGGDYFG